MRTWTLEVLGLHSEGCIERITESLMHLPGVADVTVSLLHSKVTVVGEDRLHCSRMLNALNKIGYPAVEWTEDSFALA